MSKETGKMPFFYTSLWAGAKTRRFKVGRLWFGYNANRPAAFVLWSGRRLYWHVQTWRSYVAARFT